MISDMQLVVYKISQFRPNCALSIYRLRTSSGEHLKELNHAHLASLKFKLLTNANDTDDLSIRFDRD